MKFYVIGNLGIIIQLIQRPDIVEW